MTSNFLNALTQCPIPLQPRTPSCTVVIHPNGSAAISFVLNGSARTAHLRPVAGVLPTPLELATDFDEAMGWTRWYGFERTGGLYRLVSLRAQSLPSVQVTDPFGRTTFNRGLQALTYPHLNGLAYMMTDHDYHCEALSRWATSALDPVSADPIAGYGADEFTIVPFTF